MNNTIGAIILAAGKGTRINSREINKVAYPFHGKTMIEYAVDLVESIAQHIVVVVGAYADSVKSSLQLHPQVLFAHQEEQLGTGHAVQIGMKPLLSYKPNCVLVGYGDHMMFYKQEGVKKLVKEHDENKAVVSFITTIHDNPNELAWGRIERDPQGRVLDIVEQKDATDKQREIQELNAGFYCFDYNFLVENLPKIKKSEVTGEYYLTDLIKIACLDKKSVVAMPLPFDEVGIGVNKMEELEESRKLFSQTQKS